MLEKTQQPYEFLARWKDGVLVGAHVGFVTVITDDGVVVSQTPGDVMPVNIGADKGFPIADILSQLQADAIAKCDAACVAQEESDKAAAAATASAAKISAALDAAIAALTAARE